MAAAWHPVVAYTAVVAFATFDGCCPCPPEYFPPGTPFTGHIYVVDAGADRIVQMDTAGKHWVVYGAQGNGVGQLNNPNGIYVAWSGAIYVVDRGNNRIVRFDDMTGKNWVTFGDSGSDANQFSDPRSISMDEQTGRLYVTDAGNSRVVAFDDMTGANWTAFGTHGSGVDQFLVPDGISANFTDFATIWGVCVTDVAANRVACFSDLAGGGWTTFGDSGPTDMQFRAPMGIVSGNDVRLHVVDDGNRRIVSTEGIGSYFRTVPQPGETATWFTTPRYITQDTQFRQYITDHGPYKVLRLDNISGGHPEAYNSDGALTLTRAEGIFAR